MPEWQKYDIPLRPDHAWKALPGCKVFVADRGAARFDIPQDWIIRPTQSGSIRFHDKEPPADQVRLECSVMHLNPEIDWKEIGMPLVDVMLKLQESNKRDFHHRGEVVEVKRPGLRMVWVENHYDDPEDGKLIHSRFGLGHEGLVQVLLTFDYYASMAWRGKAIWTDLLKSMILDRPIADPSRGDARHIDN
jgi:hypothetical protein